MDSIFDRIKNQVTYEELNTAMGWEYARVGHRLWIRSPFTFDLKPSLCQYIDGGWKCYASGNGGGDVISLYAAIKEIRQGEAARQLLKIFNISACGVVSHVISPKVNAMRELEDWRRKIHYVLCNVNHNIYKILKTYSIGEQDEVFTTLVRLRGNLDWITERLALCDIEELTELRGRIYEFIRFK